ncbi:MAG: anhydro-N-acetylmuramic acid kinase [Rickettsiaceae bacterium]|nr:anhydro-N-acetylmuramic acid kinase [Rickettsiaceae bacterium]
MSDLYIGFMSGTSLDGLDASLIRTDGINEFESIDNLHFPYPVEFKAKMRELLSNIGPFGTLEKQLTEFHIDATHQLLQQAKLTPKDIKAIGFHGQTIFHKPEDGITLQIGNPYLLAENTSIDVIYDFRRRDVALGGQGAPLVPIFHKLLMQNQDYPVAVINIGGVANITYIDENNLEAFDTGPGGALIDDSMLKYYKQNFDKDGKIAAKGTVDHSIVQHTLTHKYFSAPYPKSLDRNEFSYLNELLVKHKPADIIATLTYITSTSIAHALNQLPKHPKKVFLCGGGSHNLQLVSWLEEILMKQSVKCQIANISDINQLDSDYIESQAFAYLAARFFQNLPSAFPSTTNADKANLCGCLVRASLVS